MTIAVAKTPLLAGCAVAQQNTSNISNSREAITLMIDAVNAAAQDCGNTDILQHVQRIYVPKGLWLYSDPARLIANAIHAPRATTVFADIGILQQTLIGDACARIASGEIECAIIAGGEAKFRQLQANIQKIPAPETAQDTQPDETLLPEAELCLEAELQAGLMMPVGFYAIMESALRYAHGESIDANRDKTAARYQRFSEIAAGNPHAWKRDIFAAESIRNTVGKNRMLAFPYTKAHNSEWNVDQAAALILCSENLADHLGIAKDKRVYPVASTESNHMLCLSQREHLHRSAGAEIALQALLSHAQIDKRAFDLLDLYSCFPSAVQIFADALAVDDCRDLTVTGSMASAGGPLNNYVLQATCRMVELLRDTSKIKPAANGLVTSVSGMMTKQGYGLWSTQKPLHPFAFIDVTEKVQADSRSLEVLQQYEGSATIAGYTVLFQGDAPSRAIIIANTPDARRVIAYSEDAEIMHAMMQEEWCGRTVDVAGQCFYWCNSLTGFTLAADSISQEK
jgi:acetyl-CoA C-acetyltransferase